MPHLRWQILILIALVPLVLGGTLFATTPMRAPETSDFAMFWLAGYSVRTDHNPYDAAQWRDAYLSLHYDAMGTRPVYSHPPHLSLIMAPLSLLSLSQAFILWRILSQLVMVGALFLLMNLWHTERGRFYIVPLLLGLYLFRPIWTVVINGQLGGMFLFVLVVAIWLWEQDRLFLAGVFLSFLSFKTTFSVPILLFTSFWLLITRRWWSLAGLVVMAIGLTLIDLPRLSDWFAALFTHDASMLNDTISGTLTVWGVSSRICGVDQQCANLLGGLSTALLSLALIVFLVAQRNHLRPFAALSLIVPVSLLVVPYLFIYDQILLVIPIVYIVGRLVKLDYPFLVAAFCFVGLDVVAILLLMLADSLQIDVWSASLSVLILILVIWLMRDRPLKEKEVLLANALT